jgi:hypothetical protein
MPASPERHAEKMERWASGSCKLGNIVLELGMMVKSSPSLLNAGFDFDLFKQHLGDSSLSTFPPCLPWGWKGLLPQERTDGSMKFQTKKGHDTFTGTPPLVRHGEMEYAFTVEAWQAIQPHLDNLEKDPKKRAEHKQKVLDILRTRKRRSKASGPRRSLLQNSPPRGIKRNRAGDKKTT